MPASIRHQLNVKSTTFLPLQRCQVAAQRVAPQGVQDAAVRVSHVGRQDGSCTGRPFDVHGTRFKVFYGTEKPASGQLNLTLCALNFEFCHGSLYFGQWPRRP
jgi:hypothetical protein